MTQQQDAQPKKRADRFMTALGVVVNVAGLAGLVFSNFSVLVQFAAVAGVIVGIYLLLHQWGKPVGLRVLFAIACITAGCVVGTLSFEADAPWSRGGNTSEIRLTTYQGVDLDSSKRAPVDADGPNGDIDIFMAEYNYLVVNGGSFYRPDPGPDSKTYDRCTRVLTTQREPLSQVFPQKHVQLCFKTSAGKTGWLRVNDASFDGEIYAVLNVQIW